MKRAFWRAVHQCLPCRAIHLLCSECRQEGLCHKCIERKFEEWGGQAVPPGHPLRVEVNPVSGTFATATTYTVRFPKD